MTLSLPKKAARHLLLIVLASSLLSSAVLIASEKSVSAGIASNNCNLKVDKSGCEKLIRACNSKPENQRSTCRKRATARKDDVIKVCRTKENPQSCHRTVKEACEGKRGAALENCKKDKAKPLANKSAGGSGGDDKDDQSGFFGETEKNGECGEGENAIETNFDFGCSGTGNPIQDVAYTIVRFLSIGVAIVLVASIIYAGIQYSSSEGSPDATAAAKKRIQNAIAGLVFYMFIFALIQYLVPGGLFA